VYINFVLSLQVSSEGIKASPTNSSPYKQTSSYSPTIKQHHGDTSLNQTEEVSDQMYHCSNVIVIVGNCKVILQTVYCCITWSSGG